MLVSWWGLGAQELERRAAAGLDILRSMLMGGSP